jgi:hypothetical protein
MSRGTLALIALLIAQPGHAQEPQPPQRPDTVAAADTLAADTVPEPLVPPPLMPRVAHAVPTGFATGIREWDRAALMAEPYVTVNDLLDRIPGITTLRSGFYLQPEAASLWGASAGGIQVVLDGYTLQPLDHPTLDLSRIELLQLESVRVERRAGGLRIVLRTMEPFAAEPYTRVEAGIGQPALNLFRGLFLTPRLAIGPFAAGIERTEVDGIGGDEPADAFTGWAKWGWVRERYGIQLEYRQQSLEREVPEGDDAAADFIITAGDFKRRDMVVRGRWQALDGLVLEAFGGQSRSERALPDTFPDRADTPDSLRAPPPLRRDNLQLGGRASFVRGPFTLDGAVRSNGSDRLPSTELDLNGWFAAGRWGGIGASIERASWNDADATSSWMVHGVATPFSLLRLFAQYGSGTAGAPAPFDTVPPVRTEHTLMRAGGEALWRGITFGGALLSVDRDSVPPFYLPFDSAASTRAGGELRGWELFGHLPIVGGWLSADGNMTRWFEGNLGPYNPDVSWRAALSAHIAPLESGNLDILARIEAHNRGVMSLPTIFTDEDVQLRQVPARTLVDGWLIIRILSLQAFLRYEDFAGERAQDFPGRERPGPRVFYGVKWSFLN